MASILGNGNKYKRLEEDDNGGGALSKRDTVALNVRAKTAAEKASRAYAAEHGDGNQPAGGGTPAAPTYSYVPGVFNGEYGYAPTQFQGQYNYTPGEFNGQYNYTPAQFQYNSEYTDLINAARDRLANWNYDPNSDASYNAYKNQYTRAGQSAMTDALARYASKTGGVASSYAASAAQQQYNNYMAQLAAKVPELEQLAYGRAADEYARYVNADQDAYSRAFNEYSDWENRQRAQADTLYDIAWNQYTDSENRRRQQADTEYANAWDQYVDWENRQRTQADTAYDIAYQKWQMQEAAREQAAQNAYNASVAAYKAKYGGGGAADDETGRSPAYERIEKQLAGYKGDKAGAAAYLASLIGTPYITNAELNELAAIYGISASDLATTNTTPGRGSTPSTTPRVPGVGAGSQYASQRASVNETDEEWLRKAGIVPGRRYDNPF